MSRLRPGTARAISTYPETPVRYHRPFLRAVSGAFLVGESVLSVSLTFFPEGKGDDLTGKDWWLNLLFLVMLGSVYVFTASSLVVTRTHVIVRNPFRRADIPLEQVRVAIRGSNLRIKTSHRDFVAAGVEAANAQIFTDNYGTQSDLARLITKAAAEASVHSEVDSEPARYRFNWPDPLFLAFTLIHVVDAAVILLNDGPVRL
jgi:hypothetical protein